MSVSNKLIPPCSMTAIMKGNDNPAALCFDINKVPENLRYIVFNYLRSLQYLQLIIMEHIEDEIALSEIGEDMLQLEKQFEKLMVELVQDEIALSEIGEDMLQLEKQFEKLMVEIIPQSDSEAEQSDSEAEQSDSEAEQSDSEAEQSDEIRDLKYELALKNKDHELLLKDLQLKKERSKSSLLEKEILNLKSQLTSLQNNVQ